MTASRFSGPPVYMFTRA